MTYSPDLHNESMVGAGGQLRTVGWLHPDHEFARGTVPEDFTKVLHDHVSTAFAPMAFGGWHDCEFCDDSKGFGNLIVPTLDVVYVAPEMICHYIAQHGYRPPQEFVEAVMDCSEQSSPEYMDLVRPYFSYFRINEPDSLPTFAQQRKLSRLLSRAYRDIARFCKKGETDAAKALAIAFEKLPERSQGWGLWYRHIFARLASNGCVANPELLDYLTAYNDVFGEDTDPATTEYLNRICGYVYEPPSTRVKPGA